MFLHFILAVTAIGLAVGASQEHLRPLIQCGLMGLTMGLSFTAFLRLFIL